MKINWLELIERDEPQGRTGFHGEPGPQEPPSGHLPGSVHPNHFQGLLLVTNDQKYTQVKLNSHVFHKSSFFKSGSRFYAAALYRHEITNWEGNVNGTFPFAEPMRFCARPTSSFLLVQQLYAICYWLNMVWNFLSVFQSRNFRIEELLETMHDSLIDFSTLLVIFLNI